MGLGFGLADAFTALFSAAVPAAEAAAPTAAAFDAAAPVIDLDVIAAAPTAAETAAAAGDAAVLGTAGAAGTAAALGAGGGSAAPGTVAAPTTTAPGVQVSIPTPSANLPSFAPDVTTSAPTASSTAVSLGAIPTAAPGPSAGSVAGLPGVGGGAPADLTATAGGGTANPLLEPLPPDTGAAVAGSPQAQAIAAGGLQGAAGTPGPVAGGTTSNVTEFSNLGPFASGATPTSPGAVANPELGGATGFSPGGAAESAPSGGLLPNPLSNQVTGSAANSALGITPPSGSSGGFFDSLGNIVNSPITKALGIGVAGAGLAKDLLAPSTPKGFNAIKNLAASSATQGQILQQYLENGTLPPAVQASVDAATANGITAIKAKYASMGVAPGSSGEVEDINNLRQQAVIQGATLADQLLQQGISETQLSGQLYNDLITNQAAQNAQTTSAIGSLASALAGSGAKIQIGGTTTT